MLTLSVRWSGKRTNLKTSNFSFAQYLQNIYKETVEVDKKNRDISKSDYLPFHNVIKQSPLVCSIVFSVDFEQLSVQWLLMVPSQKGVNIVLSMNIFKNLFSLKKWNEPLSVFTYDWNQMSAFTS